MLSRRHSTSRRRAGDLRSRPLRLVQLLQVISRAVRAGAPSECISQDLSDLNPLQHKLQNQGNRSAGELGRGCPSSHSTLNPCGPSFASALFPSGTPALSVGHRRSPTAPPHSLTAAAAAPCSPSPFARTTSPANVMPSFFGRFKRKQGVRLDDDEKGAQYEKDDTRPPSSRLQNFGRRRSAASSSPRERAIGNYAPHPMLLRGTRFLL